MFLENIGHILTRNPGWQKDISEQNLEEINLIYVKQIVFVC